MSTFLKIHLIVCVVIALILPILILKTKIRQSKKGILIAVIVAVLFCAIQFLSPVENSFYGFATPEAAFSYYSTEEIVGSIESGQSCMVVSKDSDGSLNHYFLTYGVLGYKLPTSFSSTKLRSGTVEGGSYEILNVTNRTEMYLVLTTTLTGEVTGPEGLLAVPTEEGTTVYAPLEDYKSTVTITIGDTELTIN